jgi:hypothetical protein
MHNLKNLVPDLRVLLYARDKLEIIVQTCQLNGDLQFQLFMLRIEAHCQGSKLCKTCAIAQELLVSWYTLIKNQQSSPRNVTRGRATLLLSNVPGSRNSTKIVFHGRIPTEKGPHFMGLKCRSNQ